MTSPSRTLTAGALAVQLAALTGFIAFYVIEVLRGHADHPTRAWMSVVLMAVMAAGIGAMAWGWWTGTRWQATPTLLWCALLIPVAVGLYQSSAYGWLALVVVSVVAAAVGAIMTAMAESRPDSRN